MRKKNGRQLSVDSGNSTSRTDAGYLSQREATAAQAQLILTLGATDIFKTMTIGTRSRRGSRAVLSETEKAIKLGGNCSSLGSQVSDQQQGEIAGWFNFGLEHFFLFDAPYKEAQQ